MKNFLLAAALIVLSNSAFGQIEKKGGQAFSVAYNFMANSENLGFVWQRDFGKNEIGCGVRWHLNRIPTSDQNLIHRSARTFRQHLGGIASYKLKFKKGSLKPQFFAFAEAQFFSTGTWRHGYYGTGEFDFSPSGSGEELLKKYSIIDPEPIFCMEQIIGLGGEFEVSKNLSLMLRAGSGIFLANDPISSFQTLRFLGTRWDWNLAAMLSGGFVYRLKK